MKKVLLLLANGFETYEASVFIDVLGWNRAEGDGTTELVTCGMKREIKSSFDLRVTADLTIDEIHVDEFDGLAIPGGFEEFGFYEDAYHEKFLGLIREFNRNNKLIASVCVGALPVGKSGILRGKKATTYNLNKGIRQAQLRDYGVDVVNEPIVIEGNVITSWNPSTAMDVAFILLERLTTRKKADYIRKMMGFIA
jgi:4-methyl-5(b-hydroxyethyl)-thiazole monophosphate biosynthesis